MKIKPITILLFFLLCIPIQMLAQKNDAAATIEQLEKEMYRLYPTRNVDEFMHVTEQLKEATLKAGNEGLFYRAWANQAYFLFSKIDRQKGMDIAKAMNEHSKQQYLPNVNAAPAYIGVAKIYYNRRDKEKMIGRLEKIAARLNIEFKIIKI